jgi:D-xylose transport system substrate-binding protein
MMKQLITRFRTKFRDISFAGLITVPFVIIILTGFSFTGCSKSSGTKIGFLYSSDITYRFVLESNYFAERARELGVEVIIDHAGNNAPLQYQKALEMMDKGIDLLVLIYINANTADAIVRDVKAAGIPVMAYNRLIPGSDLDMYIAGNNKSLGESMAGYALRHAPRGNYMLFGGDKFDRNAVELLASIENVLGPSIKSGDINILYRTYTENWDGKNAAYELKQFLANSGEQPDVIMSSFDGMSHAIIQVLEEYGLAGKVILTGQDAEMVSVRDIANGKQHITLYHPWKEIAYTAADVAVEMIRGKNLSKFNIVYTDNGFKPVPTVQINSIPVTRENLDKVLIETGVYKREDIYLQ